MIHQSKIMLKNIVKYSEILIIEYLLTLNLLNFLNGIIHHPFFELSIFISGISRWELEVD